MALEFIKGTFSGGVANPGRVELGARPVAIIFGVTTVSGEFTSTIFNQSFGVAAYDNGTVTQAAISGRSGHDVASADTRFSRSSDSAYLLQGQSSVLVDGTVAIDATGFTPTNSLFTTGYTVHYTAVCGVDAAKAGIFALNSAGGASQEFATPWQGDVALFFTSVAHATATVVNTEGNLSWCLGWAVQGGGQGCSSFRAVDGAGIMTNWSFQSNTNAFTMTGSGSKLAEFAVTGFDTDSVNLNVTTVPSSNFQTCYLVIKGGAWQATSFTGSGTTGNQDITAPSGFAPAGGLFQTTSRPASTSIVDGDTLYMWSMAGPSAGDATAFWVSDDDAVTQSVTHKAVQQSAIYVGTVGAPGTIAADADWVAPSAGKATINWTVADTEGREYLALFGLNATTTSVDAGGNLATSTAPTATLGARRTLAATNVPVTIVAPDATIDAEDLRLIARPFTTLAAGSWAPMGSDSLHAAISDESDDSYIQSSTGEETDIAELTFGVTGTPGVGLVTFRVRHRLSGGRFLRWEYDGVPVDSFILDVDGTEYELGALEPIEGTTYEAVLPTEVSDGTHEIVIYAVNAEGRSGSIRFTETW